VTTTRLPRGRHSLSREEVVASQRTRILRGLAETMAVGGYVNTTVADVLRAAGVSRETFYQQFDSKADCFMAAYEAAASIVLARIEAAPDDLEAALGAYLEAIAAEPAFARLFLLEVYAAGPVALTRRAEIQNRFAERVATLLGTDDRFACEALVAATGALVTARLAADDIEGLRALREPLADLARRSIAGS
jgi:AcrR family transcriptional regulator